MLGAICGDFIGSIYEKSKYRPKRPTEVHIPKLLTRENFFTDDTVLTIATAWACLHNLDFVETYREFTREYADIGFSPGHYNWYLDDGSGPRDSRGNGAAMRVSPVAYFKRKPEDVRDMAIASARATHMHAEAISAAEVIALSVWKAKLGPELGRDYSVLGAWETEMIPPHIVRDQAKHSSRCYDTVPHALTFALDSVGFEQCMRRCIWFGVDTDTIAAMSGAIIGASHGIPYYITEHVLFELERQHKALFDMFVRCAAAMGLKY